MQVTTTMMMMMMNDDGQERIYVVNRSRRRGGLPDLKNSSGEVLSEVEREKKKRQGLVTCIRELERGSTAKARPWIQQS
jgi:hypothetical protein